MAGGRDHSAPEIPEFIWRPFDHPLGTSRRGRRSWVTERISHIPTAQGVQAFFGKADMEDRAGLQQGAGSSQSAGPGASLRAQMLKEQKEPEGSEQGNNGGGPACGSAGTYQGTGA